VLAESLSDIWGKLLFREEFRRVCDVSAAVAAARDHEMTRVVTEFEGPTAIERIVHAENRGRKRRTGADLGGSAISRYVRTAYAPFTRRNRRSAEIVRAAFSMRSSLRPIASLLLAVAFLLAGNGLQFTLLPLRGHAEAFSAFAIGVIGSGYYVGFVGGCLLAPYVILRAGHIRTFAALVALASVVGLAYPLVTTAGAWVAFRTLNGFCIAGFYLVIESWLNDRATNEARGLVMSAYVMVNFFAFSIGQLMVTLYPIKAEEDFIVAVMLVSLAIIPVALTRSAQPAPIAIVSFRPMQLYRAAPISLIASLVVGAANGAFLSLGPLSVVGNGFGVAEAAIFMSVTTVAGALAQWPVGIMSDRLDRRLVLLVLLVGAALAGVALWMFADTNALLLGIGLLFGALALPGYSLAAAHAYDKTPVRDTVPTAATILLVNACGAVIGPLIASETMALAGPRALFLFTAVTQSLLAAYVFYSIKMHAATATPEKTGFDLAATAPIGAVVTAEALDLTHPSVAVPETYTPPGDDNAAVNG
jgi:MFS family permease